MVACAACAGHVLAAPFPLRGINAEEVLGVTIVDDCPAPQPQQVHMGLINHPYQSMRGAPPCPPPHHTAPSPPHPHPTPTHCTLNSHAGVPCRPIHPLAPLQKPLQLLLALRPPPPPPAQERTAHSAPHPPPCSQGTSRSPSGWTSGDLRMRPPTWSRV